MIELLIVCGLLLFAAWFATAVLLVDAEAEQARRHRDTWLPRTDPRRAEQIRDQ